MFCDVYRVAQEPPDTRCCLWYQDAFAPHRILWKSLRQWGNLSLGNWSHFVWEVVCWYFCRNRASVTRMRSRGRYTLSVKLSDFTLLRHTWRKIWVNCAVLTGSSAGLRTVLSSRLSHRELHRSLMGIPQFPQFTCRHQHHLKALNSFSRWTSHDIFLFKYHFLLHILRFLFFFSDNIMADVTSKQQTTALFLSTIYTRTRRHIELPKSDKPDGKPVLCQRTFSSVFRAVILQS